MVLTGLTCCTNCGGTDIDHDPSRGDAVCIQCGTVLEENTIVNEVTFAQDAAGGSSVVGQFVAATPGVPSSGLGFGKESREVAFSNGQRHISQLAAALRLADHHQEAAQRLFMLAVQHNFVQGRRTQHVIAACLYTVCRREKTPHLLIDYSVRRPPARPPARPGCPPVSVPLLHLHPCPTHHLHPSPSD